MTNAKFNLNDYELVENRIARFLADYPDGRILTEIADKADDYEWVIFKASLHIGGVLISTGFAEERRGDGYVNKTSHLENCETSAIGRALANYGYHGSKRPSREEMSKVESAVSVLSPVHGSSDEWKYLSEKQQTLLFKAMKDRGLSKDDVNDYGVKNFNKHTPRGWTSREFTQWLEAIKWNK